MTAGDRNLLRRLLYVAWLAIALGIVLQIIVLLALAAMGTDARANFLPEVAGKITWSVIVCVGVALGSGIGSAEPAAMGLLGAISAPTGFFIAKTVQKAVSQGLAAASSGASAIPGPVELAIIKCIQYAILGVILGWASKRGAGLAVYLTAGATIGAIFATLLLGRTISAAANPSTPVLVARTINEVLFPLGCALVLFVASALGQRLARTPRAAPAAA